MAETTSDFSLADYQPMPAVPLAEQDTADSEANAHRVRLARAIGSCAMILGAGLAGSFAGAYHAAFTPTNVEIGPHNATIQLTRDHRINIDLGMPGNIDRETSWAFDTGLSIRVGGIPAPQDQAALVSHTGNLISQYAVLGDKNQVKNSVESAFITRVWHDSLAGGIIGAGGGLGLVGASLGTWAAMSEKRRQAFRDAFTIESDTVRQRIKVGSLAAALVLTGCVAAAGVPNQHVTKSPNAEFAGTPLQGFATHGYYLNYAVDTIVPMALRTVNGIQAFSDSATKNLDLAFKEAFNGNPIDHKKYIVLQILSDNHCGIPMNEFHAKDAKLFDADATLDTGDMVIGGLPIDNNCVAAEVDPIIKHNPLGYVNGNHGPLSALAYAQQRGAIIIDKNKPVKIAGLSVQGQGDVMVSSFGSTIRQRGNETIEQAAAAIKAAACDTHPDIVVGHEPPEVLPAAEAGCAKLVLAGHTHIYQGLTATHTPERGELSAGAPTYYMNVGTSSGAAASSFSIGTPQKEATEAMCLFTRDTHDVAGCYKITTKPDTSVSISDLQLPPHMPVTTTGRPALASPK